MTDGLLYIDYNMQARKRCLDLIPANREGRLKLGLDLIENGYFVNYFEYNFNKTYRRCISSFDLRQGKTFLDSSLSSIIRIRDLDTNTLKRIVSGYFDNDNYKNDDDCEVTHRYILKRVHEYEALCAIFNKQTTQKLPKLIKIALIGAVGLACFSPEIDIALRLLCGGSAFLGYSLAEHFLDHEKESKSNVNMKMERFESNVFGLALIEALKQKCREELKHRGEELPPNRTRQIWACKLSY